MQHGWQGQNGGGVGGGKECLPAYNIAHGFIFHLISYYRQSHLCILQPETGYFTCRLQVDKMSKAIK